MYSEKIVADRRRAVNALQLPFCGNTAHFQLVAAAPAGMSERDFRIRLYEIPHPDFGAEVLAPEHAA